MPSSVERVPVEIGLLTSENDLEAILALQRQNLPTSLSAAEARTQGFVTVMHTLPVLQGLHRALPSIVARSGGALVGYALAMSCATRELVPLLEPMFERLASLSFRGRSLSEQEFYVIGQICVRRHERGTGVFDALYGGHREHYAKRFDCTVTEVATRNTRSLRAHERMGFEHLHRYRDPTDEWAILAWDFG